MKIIGKRPSREKCAESGWFATDYLMDAPIGREFILKLKPLGGFVYLDIKKMRMHSTKKEAVSHGFQVFP